MHRPSHHTSRKSRLGVHRVNICGQLLQHPPWQGVFESGSSPVSLTQMHSLHRHTLGQVPRLVHIRALGQGRVVGQQLQRYHMQNG